MEILRTINLTKDYKDGNEVKTVLDDVNVSINRGEFIGIFGPSGSGKSTLLNLIGGLDRPSKGEIYVEGERTDHLSQSKLALYRRRRIGIVYQFYNLMSHLTVEQNMLLPVLMDDKEVDAELYGKIMNIMDLKERLQSFPESLSGGEQQRVAIARALINKPSIVLLDEPTGNLDRENRNKIFELLKYSNSAFHQTMLMVSHDEEIVNKTDRVLQIEDGKIIRDVSLR
ncbi:ABC transporter ATP-binding protein [Irregularibacter muris]|uniref:ABC transporter ATP-binding protein n=1 Tax=Irregularibacter muris TaxID=1796619 RepID=A0AAE3L3A0_9FIRM|nr:ABC transporter ATP-binding protein [Irregularibacter muris]MCR1900104.1 ABC transporter ATP-binding protein [Irregularibacter muris]